MKLQNLKSLAIVCVTSLLFACATPPSPTAPTGANKVAANSDEAIKEYSKRSFDNDKLAAEKAQLQVYTAALLRQTEELKAYITSQIVDVEVNRSKGIHTNPTMGQTPKLDEALAAINKRIASLEYSIFSLAKSVTNSANADEVAAIKKKIADIELNMPAEKNSQLSNETFDAKETIVPSKQTIVMKPTQQPLKNAAPVKVAPAMPLQQLRVERKASDWSGRNAAAVAAGLEYVEKQNVQPAK